MDTAKVFRSGRSQAVRLPKDYRFEVDEVLIHRIGDMVILFPGGRGWDVLARGIEQFTDDCLAERRQPAEAEGRRRL